MKSLTMKSNIIVMEIITMKRQYISDDNSNDAKAIKTCWTWVPVGSALKIHACPAPGDHHDDGLHYDDMNCDIAQLSLQLPLAE